LHISLKRVVQQDGLGLVKNALGSVIGKRLGRDWTSDKASAWRVKKNEDLKSRLQIVQCGLARYEVSEMLSNQSGLWAADSACSPYVTTPWPPAPLPLHRFFCHARSMLCSTRFSVHLCSIFWSAHMLCSRQGAIQIHINHCTL